MRLGFLDPETRFDAPKHIWGVTSCKMAPGRKPHMLLHDEKKSCLSTDVNAPKTTGVLLDTDTSLFI
jgi:hypothetical protein